MPKNDFYLTYKYTGNTVKVLVRNEKNTTIVTEKGEIDTYNSGVYFEVDIYDALREQVVPSNPNINDFACYRNVPCHQVCFP